MSADVRFAGEADIPAVKALMREFVDYLNAIDEPEDVPDAVLDRLGPLAFGPNKLCTALIAEVDGEPAGYLLYFTGIFTDPMTPVLFVADLFVSEPFRRANVGSALMRRTREIAREHAANQIVWTVWRKNPKAVEFYESLGARVFEEEILMTWPVERLEPAHPS